MKKRNRIYTRIPLHERFWQNVNKTDDCWLWTGAVRSDSKFPYGVINSGGHGGKALRAHRLSYEMHHGEIPKGYFVCHRCDNPRCVNPDHLFLGTNKDNMVDCKAKGRNKYPGGAKGEDHPMARFTQEQIDKIRSEYAGEKPVLRVLAERYDASITHIHRIVRGKSWN